MMFLLYLRVFGHLFGKLAYFLEYVHVEVRDRLDGKADEVSTNTQTKLQMRVRLHRHRDGQVIAYVREGTHTTGR